MEDLRLNNLRVVLKLLLYDVSNRYYRENFDVDPDLRDSIRRSGFRLEVPSNQINYMLTPMFQFRRRFRGRRRERGFDDDMYRYKFKISFCLLDGSSTEEKIAVMSHARRMLMYVNHFLFEEFDSEGSTNALDLRFLSLRPQAFVGLYESRQLEGAPDPRNAIDIVNTGSVVLSRWSSYYGSLNLFFRDWYFRFRESLDESRPEFPVRQVDEEVGRFRETGVIESPGLSLAALNRLLGIRDPGVEKTLFVSWNVRVDFSVNGPAFRDRWLPGQNLGHLENAVVAQSRRWRDLLRWQQQPQREERREDDARR